LLTVNITIDQNVSCNGANDGQATATSTGGTPIYSYIWNTTPAQLDSAAIGLEPITHIVLDIDSNGCTATDSITITQPDVLVASIDSITHVSCFGGNDGSALIIATGGTTPYSYSWNTSPVQTDSLATNLDTGIYIGIVTDANGCITSSSVTINQPPPLAATTTSSVTVCSCPCAGVIRVVPTGGTQPYTIIWSNGYTDQFQTQLCDGTYDVTITDANGCTDSQSAIVNNLGAPVASIVSSADVLCNGGADGAADLAVSGGTIAYTYAWSNSATSQDLTNLTAGTYTVTVTDKGALTGTCEVMMTAPSQIVFTTSSVQSTCGLSNGQACIDAGITGGTGPYTYTWGIGSTTSCVSGVLAGNYPVTVRDANSCSGIGAENVTDGGSPNIAPTVLDPAPVFCLTDLIQITALGSGGSLWWYDNTMSVLDSGDTYYPVATLGIDTFYVVEQSGACPGDSTQVIVTIDEECSITTYSGLAPNSIYSENARFIIDGILSYPENSVIIFNRWGDIVNEFVNYDNLTVVWNGRNKNDDELPAGTYFFIIDYADLSKKGWVQIEY
ncbi:MAG: gliding motility-associated C-terminal domain-containing protein, partial [Bacteroidetes bacterium]|nr:gliding motility-associated C-terminal domain-containing protein [Bacteroidota bacterium]